MQEANKRLSGTAILTKKEPIIYAIFFCKIFDFNRLYR